jgi:drug/metabolite transporter (DMT)-like permease
VDHKSRYLQIREFITPTLAAFLGIVILAGGVSVAIRLSYAELPTFWGAAMRFGPAAVVLWAVVILRRIRVPLGRELFVSVLFGFLSIGVSRSLMYWGLEKTPASLHQIIVSLTPLLTLFFAYFHGHEKISSRNLLSALLACGGIAIAFGGMGGGDLSFIRLLALIIAAGCLAEGGVIMKGFSHIDPIAVAAIATTVGTIVIVGLSLVNREVWVLPSSPQLWVIMAYLTIGASVLPLLLYLYVLKRWPASSASYPMVLMPFVTVLFATSLTDERITWVFILGGLLVLVAVCFGALMPKQTSFSHETTEKSH